jgi:hypothetical protein
MSYLGFGALATQFRWNSLICSWFAVAIDLRGKFAENRGMDYTNRWAIIVSQNRGMLVRIGSLANL